MCSIKDTCRPAHHGGAVSAVGWGMKLLPPSSGGWSRLVGRSTWPVTGDGKDEVLTSHKMCFFSWVTVSGGFISFRVANVFTHDGKTDFGNVLTHYFFIFYFFFAYCLCFCNPSAPSMNPSKGSWAESTSPFSTHDYGHAYLVLSFAFLSGALSGDGTPKTILERLLRSSREQLDSLLKGKVRPQRWTPSLIRSWCCQKFWNIHGSK